MGKQTKDCPDCGCELEGKEIEDGLCRPCQLAIAEDIAITSDQEHLLPLEDDDYWEDDDE